MCKPPPNSATARAPQSARATTKWRVLSVGLWMGLGSSAFADPPLLTSPPLSPNPPVSANPTLTTDSPITRDSPNNVDFFVADQFNFDDNLYRLPAYVDVTSVAGPMATRQDGFNSFTLGGNGRWFSDSQTFGLDLRADDNRYVHNNSLDNISGRGNLDWDWRLASLWSGEVGVSYYRGLANFADTGYYARDVVQRADYFGSIRYDIGPHWAVYGGFIGADTTHSAQAEQLYDFHSKAGNAGIELATSSQNTLTFDYRYTDATFPQDFVLNGAPFNSDYKEETTRVILKYVFSVATELDASAGYLRREYPQASFATFSGDIWKAALQWQPTDHLQFVLTGWRQLTAYVEAESNYFVSTGVALAPAWIVADTLTLSVGVSHENHDYIPSSPSDLTYTTRLDKLTTGQARLSYTPTSSLTFKLAVIYEQRQSNEPQFQFNDTLATASVTYMIRP
jgi:Putative beta-barrel porin 2